MQKALWHELQLCVINDTVGLVIVADEDIVSRYKREFSESWLSEGLYFFR